MANQKSYFLFIVTLGIIISFTLGSATFVVGYIILVFGLFALNTISYDEMDNGYAFLFTLPISRADYVKEKYVYGILSGNEVTIALSILGGLTVTLRVLVAFVVIFLMLTISYFISVYIMRKKDF